MSGFGRSGTLREPKVLPVPVLWGEGPAALVLSQSVRRGDQAGALTPNPGGPAELWMEPSVTLGCPSPSLWPFSAKGDSFLWKAL